MIGLVPEVIMANAAYADLVRFAHKGEKAIAILGVGAMIGATAGVVIATPTIATVAAVAGAAAATGYLIDNIWDDIKENTGGFLDDPEGFVRDIFQNVPLSKLLDKDTQQCLPDSLIEESQREFGNAETLESPLIFDLNGDGVGFGACPC